MTVTGDRPAVHTSDRALFRRCRRQWDLASPLRQNLVPDEASPKALWFGTGVHFALEDFHGYNQFGWPQKAFGAYASAFDDAMKPDDADELVELADGMLSYYAQHWLPKRNEFRTLWVGGVPQVEVRFTLRFPDFDYNGTLDRVAIDTLDRLWIQDYKTAAAIDIARLELDDQITSYSLAGTLLFGPKIEGLILTQLRKAVPEFPKRLLRGGFSVAKQQKTTHSMFRQALVEEYGVVPQEYIEHLNWLAEQESPEGDHFIRQDLVRRNQQRLKAQLGHIAAETSEMFDPALRIYPNPSRDCSSCRFREPCVSMDDGSDWQELLELGFKKIKGRDESWRTRINWPNGQPPTPLRMTVQFGQQPNLSVIDRANTIQITHDPLSTNPQATVVGDWMEELLSRP